MSLAQTDEDRDFEHSPLSGSFSRVGEKVDVEIYRYAGTQDPWRLVVVDLSSGRLTAWSETFATEQYAYDAFTARVDAEGMGPFTEVVPPVRHEPPHPPASWKRR